MKRTCFKTKEKKKAVELISVVRSRKPFKDPIEGILWLHWKANEKISNRRPVNVSFYVKHKNLVLSQ